MPSRSGKCQWILAALEAGIDDENAEVRELTLSNLMSDDGPTIRVSIPLLSEALSNDHDHAEFAESVLARLGRDATLDEIQSLEQGLPDSPHPLATRILLLGYYFLFRIVGHYLSLRGARQGLVVITWTKTPSAALTKCAPLALMRSISAASLIASMSP